MNIKNEKIPDPKELEKELSEFLSKKFGNNIKVLSPTIIPHQAPQPGDDESANPADKSTIHFDLKPEELIAYLDQYIIRQDRAKAILATKICTHFNRIRRHISSDESLDDIVGGIKNNVLMIGSTGVGKTYMIKLIAKKIGVPFVKGDATKFSETGYVGGDVEDLVRDLVREANDNIQLAECGIIYIDEIDKIASSHNWIGADVSRTGVQRALLKPMEETEVDLKVAHDPISIMREMENYRKTGKREKQTVNTKNILFIMSGAFTDLVPIVKKRLSEKGIGFGARIENPEEQTDYLKYVTAEDLTWFGFESEFVGRLPVKAFFERLSEKDLYSILSNPNNPVILGKKLDFAAYGINVKFEDEALHLVAKNAFSENTGARGLVSAIEEALLPFEKKLPSTNIKAFPVTAAVIEQSEKALDMLFDPNEEEKRNKEYQRLVKEELERIRAYVISNKESLATRHNLTLNPSRIDLIAEYNSRHITDIGTTITRLQSFDEDIKKIELSFLKSYNINIVFMDDAADELIRRFAIESENPVDLDKKFSNEFGLGLKLVRDKTGKDRFFIPRKALLDPEGYISDMLKADDGNRNTEGP